MKWAIRIKDLDYIGLFNGNDRRFTIQDALDFLQDVFYGRWKTGKYLHADVLVVRKGRVSGIMRSIVIANGRAGHWLVLKSIVRQTYATLLVFGCLHYTSK